MQSICRTDPKVNPFLVAQPEGVGRGGGIRTPDILLPKQARYQTALHPEDGGFSPRAARSLPALRIVGNAQQNAFPHRLIFARIAPVFRGDLT